MSEANSELLLLLFISQWDWPKNCPKESSESEIQQSLSAAKTEGNFSCLGLLIIFKLLNAFR